MRRRGRPCASESIEDYWPRLRKMAKAMQTLEEMGAALGVHPDTVRRDIERDRKRRRRSRRGKSK